jgi:nitrite reductase/ring-hydroxylating ferredoxin subunit
MYFAIAMGLVGFAGFMAKTEGSDGHEIEAPSDLSEGEIRPLKANETEEIIVAKYKGKIHAVGNRCTYKGSRLTEGFMVDDKIVSPDYNCAYSVVTGMSE